MILLDEVHTVEMIVGEERHTVATGHLCSDADSLDKLRARVIRDGASYFRVTDTAALGHAFDSAFDDCDARAGNESVGSSSFEAGEVIVTRRLAA